MSVDAVAILRIAGLPEPLTPFGIRHPVTHRGDATLINLMVRFDGQAPDEHALALLHLVGPALDAHEDPRGILFFPDVRYPKSESYAAMVEEMAPGGVWAPKVGADYVPARYTAAPAGTHDALVGQMIAVMGYNAATAHDVTTEVQAMLVADTPGDPEAVARYEVQLDAVRSAMGAEFAARYDASLRAKVDASMRAPKRQPIVLECPPLPQTRKDPE